jgi:hypothetical protein
MRKIFFALCVLLMSGLLSANTPRPERKVKSNSIVSDRDPRIRIKVPKTAHYVGADRWDLYEIADCEVHLFVEADKQKNVKSYYWIQFESYLPTKPEYSYNYKNGQSMTIAGLEFNVRARFGTSSEQPKAGSDLEHVLRLLATKGYKLPADIMNVRLVHLLDESKRKELMIIYGEDMAPTGFTTAKLIADGKIRPEWTAIENDLISRAKQKIIFNPQK